MRKRLFVMMGLCVCWAIMLANNRAWAIEAKPVLLQQGMGPLTQQSYYDTLQEAFDHIAYNYAQITLLDSVEESVIYTGMYSVTLDLNGKILKGKGDTALSHTGFGALILESGVSGGGIEGAQQAILVRSQRGLTIHSGEYWATQPDGVAIVNESGMVSIQEYGGTIWIQGSVAIRDDSEQTLELDGGQLIGTGAGFAVEKLAGSLSLDGDTQIQGKMGGLLLCTGPKAGEIEPGEKSRLYLKGALLNAAQPGGIALAVNASPGWDVEMAGVGTLAADTALALEGGVFIISDGAQIQLDGGLEGGPGLLLQGGQYREAPEKEWIGAGLYATVDAAGWYTLGTTPPEKDDQQDGNKTPGGFWQQAGAGAPEAIDAGLAVPIIPIPQGEGEAAGMLLLLPKTGQHKSWMLPVLLVAGSLAGLFAKGRPGAGLQESRKSGKGH